MTEKKLVLQLDQGLITVSAACMRERCMMQACRMDLWKDPLPASNVASMLHDGSCQGCVSAAAVHNKSAASADACLVKTKMAAV